MSAGTRLEFRQGAKIAAAVAALIVFGALLALFWRGKTTSSERREAQVSYENALRSCHRGNSVRLHQYQLARKVDAVGVIAEMRAEPHARRNGTLICSNPEVVEKP
jgi:hypothetical protein